MPIISLPILKVAFVAFDFCGAYINNYLCRVRTIMVEKCYSLTVAVIKFKRFLHGFPERRELYRVAYHPMQAQAMREGGYDVKIFLCYCINFFFRYVFMLIMVLSMCLLKVFDLDVIPLYICHGEIYSCYLFVLCILSCLNECGKIDRLMEFYKRKIVFTQLVITEISSL
ncbi:hypothetical protein ACJX0J_019252, partial [Zea mays]